MWFCTENGLSRFDGSRFVNYTVEQGLPDDEVNDLLETRSGAYWIATGNGLVRYNPKGLPLPFVKVSLQLPSGKASPQSDPMFTVYRVGAERITSIIKALYEDRSGTIWVGTWRGLYRLEQIGDQARFHFIDLGSEPHIVRNILEDREGVLWLTTDIGLYRRSPDGTVDRFTRSHGFSSEKLMGLIEDRQGRLWVGDRNGGLCLLVADPGVSRTIVARQYTTKDGLGCVRVGALYAAKDGRIWIGADCGLAELLPDSGGGRRLSMALSDEELTDTRVWSLAEDSHGNLWVGTANGAVKVSRGGFTTYTEADGLGSRDVCSIMETRSGELCVYTRSNHQAFINRFDGKRFIAIKLNLPSHVHPGECGLCLQDGEGRWWIAADKQLLRFPKAPRVDDFRRLRPEAFFPKIATLSGRRLSGVQEDRRDDFRISIGDRTRLFLWDRNAASVHVYAEAGGLASAGVDQNYSAEDREGNLWMSAGEAGLVRYAKGRFKLFTAADGIPAGTIQTLFIDSKGRLWIASSLDGLARIDDPAAERPAIITYTDHLSDLVRRMRRVASEALPSRDIEFTFNTPAPGVDLKLGADIRRQVFLMFKETINNLVRHSKCTLASIHLRIEGRFLALTVTDNGIGFETDRINEGNGLISLHRRARSLGGETVVSSRKGEGATVMIKIPYSKQSRHRRGNG